MRAMVGVNARIAHRRRRHRTRASFRLGPWVVLAVLVSLVVPGAFAAPFADRTALKAAVDSCITLDPTGVACCNHGADCGAAGPVEMPDWDVSQVTSMSELFYNKGSFNADISRWDTSSVTTMYRMFRGARAFNQDIGTWDTSSVTTMSDVLRHRRVQPGYRYMGHLERHEHVQMFRDCHAFNKDIGAWDTSSVTTMSTCSTHHAFNQDIGHGTPRASRTCTRCSTARRSTRISVHGIPRASRPCTDVLRGLRVQSAPIEMGRQLGHDHEVMFYDANAFNTMPVGWDTSKVTDSIDILFCSRMEARFTGGDDTPSPVAGGRARTTRATRPIRPSTAPSAPAPTPS